MEKRQVWVVEHIKSGRVFGVYDSEVEANAKRESLYTKFPNLMNTIFVQDRMVWREEIRGVGGDN